MKYYCPKCTWKSLYIATIATHIKNRHKKEKSALLSELDLQRVEPRYGRYRFNRKVKRLKD